MADKNQLKIADQADFPDDDPFAELTRIMGFDPRQPAKRPEPAALQPLTKLEPVAVQQAQEDDFSLDLEKELLGDFVFEEEQDFSAAAASQAYEVEAPQADFAETEFAAEAGYVQQAGLPEVDFDFGDVFEEPSQSGNAVGATEPEPPLAAADDDYEPSAAHGMDFDLGVTDEDMHGFDLADEAPADPVSGARPALPITPQEVAAPVDDAAPFDDSGMDLDAAMADIDMSFLDEAPLAEAVATQPSTLQPQAGAAAGVEDDLDFNVFDDADFRLADETVPSGQEQPEAVEQIVPAEMDAAAFDFGMEDLRFESDDTQELPAHHSIDDTVAPDSTRSGEPAQSDDFAFDDLDFAADPDFRDAPAAMPAAEMSQPAAVAGPDLSAPKPSAAGDFEFSIPPYVPRKLPSSPMDVAAEEFRQRETTIASAEPEFNLEDELNALLGNAKASEASASGDDAVVQPVPAVADPMSSTAAAFDAPAHQADVDDNLSWELEDAFTHATDSGEQERVFAPDDDYASQADLQTDDDFGQIDLDGAFDDLAAEPATQESEIPYREAVAQAAVGAAISAPGSAARMANWQEPVRAASNASPHRDPVVRGNPLAVDPLDIINELAEKYSRKEPVTPYGRTMNAAMGGASLAYDEQPDYEATDTFEMSSQAGGPPEIETVEVHDRAVALADDLDIPELPEDEELPTVAAYDDLDAEFSSLLNELKSEPAAPAQAKSVYEDPLAGGFSARPYESKVAAATPAQQAYDDMSPEDFALDMNDLYGGREMSSQQFAAEDFDYDPAFEQEIAPQQFAAAEKSRKLPSRGVLVAGLVGGVALIGAIGAFAFSGGGSADAPTIVKADEGPVKVRPENPGGTTVPNQDSKVYETVAGETGNDGPQQEQLVTTTEEPMDVTPPASGKSEDRIEQIVQDAADQSDSELTAVAPRKVRTMVVKPDGTLVPRDDEPEAMPSDEQTNTIASAPSPADVDTTESTGALAPVSGGAAVADGSTPDTAPVAPLRPAEQPVDVVGEVAPTQVAAATTAAASAGGWAMQIASQPSEAAAQSSYKDLVRRYGSVLQGRDVNIVKAEIDGKGTFWRVRVPASSRSEAINLCESYKAAGGNCFVSR